VLACVLSVSDCLAAHGHSALVLPLFSCTAPDLELAYASSDQLQGRRHKGATTADQILGDLYAALSWLRARYPLAAIHVLGFCFGGYVAFLAVMLPGVAQGLVFAVQV